MDFFNKEELKVEEKVEDQNQPETIKIGEESYTQEQLQHLVGLGKIGAEAESKFQTKIDRVWPEYTKSRQEIEELKKQIKARDEAEATKKVQEGTPLSPEETRDLIRKQGKEVGIMFQEDFDNLYLQRRSAEKLLEDVQAIVVDVEEKGKPKTSVEAVLRHMEETGIKNPTKAYNDLYETELEKWKQEQMGKVRPSGFMSTSQSTAGGKEPEPIKVTKENLGRLVSEALNGS
jgi:hypothetical protein